MFVLWLAVAVLFIAVEVHTVALYAVFVALGSAAAAATDLLGGSLWLQGALFVVITVGGWLLVRPLLRRYFEFASPVEQLPGIQSSVDGMVGQRAITVDTVGDEHHPGHALLAGDRWLAVTDTGQPLPPQVPVVVIAVRGTTLLVRPAPVVAPPPVEVSSHG
jgi:membrane protein implicated in regulation of membrane protease activity